jgi:hypothetical protein
VGTGGEAPVKVEGPQPSSNPGAGEVRQHREAPLGGEEKTVGQSAAAVAATAASAATTAACLRGFRHRSQPAAARAP